MERQKNTVNNYVFKMCEEHFSPVYNILSGKIIDFLLSFFFLAMDSLVCSTYVSTPKILCMPDWIESRGKNYFV